jgi:hypothetical protein
MKFLASYMFVASDLNLFSNVSGDYNSIHIDAVMARRTIFGEQIVHGMLTALKLLDAYLSVSDVAPKKLSINFSKPIYLNRNVNFYVEELEGNLRLVAFDEVHAETVSISLRGIGGEIDVAVPNVRPLRDKIDDLGFDDLKNSSGIECVCAAESDLLSCFPYSHKALGSYRMAVLLSFTRIIGMKAPGAHSIFSSLIVDFTQQYDPTSEELEISWRVSGCKSKIAPVTINIEGYHCCAKLQAFIRPKPIEQPKIQAVQSLVRNDDFIGQKALIVGGSRGLGEVAAKCIAAGGGEVTITYSSGEDDAKNIQQEINDNGGSCNVRQFNIFNSSTEDLLESISSITHMYYFASCQIIPNYTAFDVKLYEKYLQFYVSSFQNLSISLITVFKGIRIFYPSTVYINERKPGYTEYLLAKADGEKICHELNLKHADSRIKTKRLPALATDQTNSIIPKSIQPTLRPIYLSLKEMR